MSVTPAVSEHRTQPTESHSARSHAERSLPITRQGALLYWPWVHNAAPPSRSHHLLHVWWGNLWTRVWKHSSTWREDTLAFRRGERTWVWLYLCKLTSYEAVYSIHYITVFLLLPRGLHYATWKRIVSLTTICILSLTVLSNRGHITSRTGRDMWETITRTRSMDRAPSTTLMALDMKVQTVTALFPVKV